MTYASRVNYPYLLALASNDVIVDNVASKKWHEKTHSQVKQLKQVYGCHELSKEPNNHSFFEGCLSFMGTQVQKAKPFGKFECKEVRQASQRPFWGKKRFWKMLIFVYLLVGLLIAVIRRQRKMFFSWPALLVIAKRLRP